MSHRPPSPHGPRVSMPTKPPTGRPSTRLLLWAGRLSYTFYDKGGQSVLSRQMNGSEALDTYYVYDACGLLRAVLPPKASAMLESQTGALDMSSATVADLTYLYRYDRRGRPVGVRRPGAQEVRYLYDDTDRPVFSQDGVQRRSGEWSYSIPDALGREVLRGTCKTLGGSNLAQSLLDGKTLVARYDGSSGDAGYAVLLDGQAVELAGGRFLSAQYYDSYDFLSRSEFSELGFENDPNYGKRYTGGDKSLHTGSIRTSLSPQQTVRMPEAYYYDLHGRLVQCNGRNHLGGKDRYLARYDFTGRPVQTRESHSSSASGSQRGLTTTLAYDHDGRLSQRRTTLSSVTTPLTARYSYDEAGRLSEKTLGSTPVSYAYNVRGWIGKIASAPFVSELRYENPRYGGAPLYSGMVSQWTWKHGQQPENDYVFSYDGVGRMVAAKHFVDGARTDGYTERGIRYDANGNLLSISRTAGGAVSDSLRFTLGGDVLLDVSGTSTGVFEYDPSGNLVKDGLNRLEFSYNCLNLMQTVQTTVGASKAQFTYGSDGRKLSEKAGTGGFEYLGSLIYAYRGGTLSLAQAVTDEGTIQSAGVNYFIRDHLGSVRAVVDHTGKTVERNDYYPFGGRHENSALSLSATNRYKFGGKESLEQVNLDMLDFGARFYDPRIARWNTQDPLAEKNNTQSPYAFCNNNPVNVIDPDGKDGIYVTFPQYRADGYPFTGHAGVLLIDNKSGYTKYYEYGRYRGDPNGFVNNYPVPNVVMENGYPTAESLNNVLSVISNESGKSQRLEGAYVRSDDFDAMNEYAKQKLAERTDPDREKYDIFTNNCGTFAHEVLKQDKQVDAPMIVDPRPVSIIDEYQKSFTPISFDPGKGTSMKFNDKTVIYDVQKNETTIRQSLWQKLWRSPKK